MVGSDKNHERKSDKYSPGQAFTASGPSPIFLKSNSDKNISKDA